MDEIDNAVLPQQIEEKKEVCLQPEWYENLNLEDTETFIRSNLMSAARNVIAIGYYLKHIRDNELYRQAGYDTIWDYAGEQYGFSKSTTSRYMSRNDKFSKGGNSPVLDARYQRFSKAQLQEMLSLNEQQLEQVTPDMTVAQIREMRKPKEVPYYEMEGQMEFEMDFPEIMPDPEPELPVEPQVFEMDVADMIASETADQEETESIATSQQPEEKLDPMSDYNFRERHCNALARKLIQCWKSWFEQDFQNRVLDVIESERQIKEKNNRASNRTWYFYGPDGELLHANMFDGYIQFWGRECLGNCEWFYLTAAIQRMWMEMAIEEARQKYGLQATLADAKQIEQDVIDVEFAEVALRKQLEEEKPQQPELPKLKNNEQRAAFINAYETWQIWIETKETGERYYRYELPDAAMVVKVYYHKCFDYNASGELEDRYHDAWGNPEYYLMKDEKHFKDCQTNRSTLIEYLKEIQKRD